MLTNDTDYSLSEIVIFGVPFDGTTSYRPGTRFAPGAIRHEFYGLETYSPYLDKNLNDLKLFDAGDLELPLGNTKKVLNIVENFTSSLINDGKKPLMLGGEHLVTLPVVKSLVKKYPDLYIIQFDAHTDLRKEYLGEQLSHATIMYKIWQIIGDNRIFQLGIRSGEKTEFEFSNQHTFLHKYNLDSLPQVLKTIGNSPVYLTVDLDVLDPSVFPGTGTPEPGGISFNELLLAIHSLKDSVIVGADIVELSPHYDTSGISTITACKVLRELALVVSC